MSEDTLAILGSILITAVLGGGGLWSVSTPVHTASIDGSKEAVASTTESASRTVIVPILVYHTVRPIVPTDSAQERYYNTSPDLFAKEMTWLKDNGYHAISYPALVDAILHDGALPPKPVLLTLDDGTASQWDNAFPALKSAGLTGTFFIFTNAIDRPHYMTKDELLQMQAAGMDIEGHTRYHPFLTKQDDANLDAEIAGSKKTLEGWLGKPIVALAYPFGAFNDRVIAKTKASGYLAARGLFEGSTHGGSELFSQHAWLMHEDWNRFLRAMKSTK